MRLKAERDHRPHESFQIEIPKQPQSPHEPLCLSPRDEKRRETLNPESSKPQALNQKSLTQTWTCAVCLQKSECDEVRRLNCGHCFHSECIKAWFRRGRCSLCPLGRCPVSKDIVAAVRAEMDFSLPAGGAWQHLPDSTLAQDARSPAMSEERCRGLLPHDRGGTGWRRFRAEDFNPVVLAGPSADQALASLETLLLGGLADHEHYIFDGLMEVAQESPSLAHSAGRCFYFYALCFGAFPAVWRRALDRLSGAAPFPRLQAQLRVLRGVLETEKQLASSEGSRASPPTKALAGGLASQVLGSLLQVLEQAQSHRLVGEIAPALAAVANAAPREFHNHFEDSADLLLGWAAGPGLSDDQRVVINAAFASFGPHWRDERHRPFATAMQRKVVADMQKLVEGDREALHALLYCFYGISVAMGNLGEFYETAAPIILKCIGSSGNLASLSMQGPEKEQKILGRDTEAG
ncbi:unnamed protein product [Symbiodinium sp. CCMP2592]|nr:unnamed protein product [Symbiodinium sp. CCMP2592]